jgi:hypothetical protein
MRSSSFVARISRRVVVTGIAWMVFGLYLFLPTTAFAQSTSYVRVIHASPFVGTADVFVDGKKLLSSFQFAAVTDYVPVPAGVHKVQISLVGKGINASVITQELTIGSGLVYTVAALGAKEDSLSLHVFVDNNLVVPNHAKVRLYQLSPDADKVNISAEETVNLQNVSYPFASDYLSLTEGKHTFNFTNPQTNAKLPVSTTVKANTVISVFAVGLFNGDPKIQLVVAQVPGIPSLPSTGSYPVLIDKVIAQPIFTWLLLGTLIALIVAAPFVRNWRRRARTAA